MDSNFDFKKLKLIVGLGNIGNNYIHTRHNAGFMFVDKYITHFNLNQFTEDTKFKAFVSKNNDVIVTKPTTLMNRSGRSVQQLLNYFKINPDEILVAHDDLDIQLGNYKVQFGVGPKVHNGILSIENSINTNQFWRLRIGIDNRSPEDRMNISGQSYVLSNFSLAERDTLDSIIQKVLSEFNSQPQINNISENEKSDK